ncbi:uncharacterized protein LOC131151907 isoform X2 [Malania oleifera]|uniref:uncharacterized protein LOC131151907 isoform X2 n=1 Tax=Malania oleifera TaxID=397392 RepID=UPI0025ADED96|nr:uncharacterized protein LOC131151907 isoform X2 [Malania oleifera]XP_057959374.1 uncharacterized protein LOC131151907 isoform X2 [Malania oleifera]XP_057959375.1 uncharacterized protein LOC131151907 isoform X2 [Malania oleifera]XP_057959376.1 uncharacterized protein LOC131151907 isoform X2 [Malania oleifera]
MSNNLVSQQLPVSTQQMGQMDPISNLLGTSIPNLQMGPMGSLSANPSASRQLSISDNQMGLPLSNSPAMNKQMEQIEAKVDSFGSHQFSVPVKQHAQMEEVMANPGSNKRRAPIDSMSNNPASQQFSMSNKRMAQMRPFSGTLGLQSFPVPNKRTTQMAFMPNAPGSQHLATPRKKTGQMESSLSKSGAQQVMTPKSRGTQMGLSPHNQTESFESVRSKMRESLIASLALVSQQQDKPPNIEKDTETQQDKSPSLGKDSQSETAIAPGLTQGSLEAAENSSEKPMGTLPSKDYYNSQKPSDGQNVSQEIITAENTVNSTDTRRGNVQNFQPTTALPDVDVSFSDGFFAKDELLQGNGLSWAVDIDTGMAKPKEIQAPQKQKLVGEEVVEEVRGKAVQSPQTLAFEIESELFKLFGGVNKKYKEKGRSLLFNLKDRSNPELRERVIAGEISPKRLCSMTAEELASKELSQWRIAKAEELAQMVVLLDTEVDVRRLVKKTHKGEFQVEVEQDDSVSVEVSVGANALTQMRAKKKEKEARPASKSDGAKDETNGTSEKSNLEDQNNSSAITIIPNEGTDLMQGLMVDELKDAEFLPPIVSLDEFMESLDSEPPFENIPLDAGKKMPVSDKVNSEIGSELKSSDLASNAPVDTTPDKPEKMEESNAGSDMNVKSSEIHLQSETLIPSGASMGEHFWEGLLQLNVSAVATVNGFFRSGEKTSTKEWPSFLEIKGRVRLDAFEKFIQELPNSRSRAIMVIQFVSKEGSPESEREALSEVVESYILDERLGFAEPAPGIELYFCPPHTRTLELLSKHLPKQYTETLNASDNSLIGVTVWRKTNLSSTISPKSSSHFKHGSRKPQYSRRQQERETNMNANFSSRPPQHMGPSFTNPNLPLNDDDGDDDIPPGFGPATARDEDDLPEFKFSGGSNPPMMQSNGQNVSQVPGRTPLHPPQAPSRPVEQMRELIHKYGQPGTNAASGNFHDRKGLRVATQPWEDEDDDIPEWQPHTQTQPQPQPQSQPQTPKLQGLPPPMPQPTPAAPIHSFQQPMPPLHLLNQPHLGVLPPLQPPMNVIPSTWSAPSTGPHGLPTQGAALQPINVGIQSNTGQFFGIPPSAEWRQGAPRSRGL